MGAWPRSRIARQAAALVTALLAAFGCLPAEAHLNSTGMGPVYDGLSHFAMSPDDLVPVLALALLAGLRGADAARRALIALPAAWLTGCLLGMNAPAVHVGSAWAALNFLVLGGLVVADAKLSPRVLAALAVVLGLAHGYLNGSGLGRSGQAFVAVLGLASAVFVTIALVSAFVVRLRAHWARIAVRVAGSWIAASGLLMLGWALRGT
ncbi:MAG: HupE/UreJ family protein [Steroidobacteraceae bacterium]